jgi:RNA polymerase sigma factor (sigma-70 family)
MPEHQLDRTASDREDLEVIRAVLAGNTNAFAQLDRKYRRKLYGVIRSIVRNDDDAQDLVQDTLLKAFRALDTYKQEYPFEKWLFKIASNTCIDYIRRTRFAPERLELDDSGGDAPVRQYIDHDSPIPDEELIRKERTAILSSAIESLPEKYRIVIELRHEREMEYADIAEYLGVPLGTVKAHLFRARQLLLKKLESHRHLFEP